MADDALAELLSEWEREQARGRDVPVAELCRDRPELAPQLEQCLRALRGLNGLVRAAGETAALHSAESRPEASVAAPVALPALPGYEVLGKLGEGGMGVVFRARDLTLKRLVAVKMLPHPAPSAEGLARFRVHRDLKPANVLLAPPADEPALNTAYGLPKVSDFGLSKALGEDQGQTAGGVVLGTPGYMAPEQASGRPEDVGPAADVYALGVILYELLTGQVPFRGRSVLETLEQVRTQPPRPPGELCPGLPVELEAVCLRCLAKSPADRYPMAQALAEALQAFLGGATAIPEDGDRREGKPPREARESARPSARGDGAPSPAVGGGRVFPWAGRRRADRR